MGDNPHNGSISNSLVSLWLSSYSRPRRDELLRDVFQQVRDLNLPFSEVQRAMCQLTRKTSVPLRKLDLSCSQRDPFTRKKKRRRRIIIDSDSDEDSNDCKTNIHIADVYDHMEESNALAQASFVGAPVSNSNEVEVTEIIDLVDSDEEIQQLPLKNIHMCRKRRFAKFFGSDSEDETDTIKLSEKSVSSVLIKDCDSDCSDELCVNERVKRKNKKLQLQSSGISQCSVDVKEEVCISDDVQNKNTSGFQENENELNKSAETEHISTVIQEKSYPSPTEVLKNVIIIVDSPENSPVIIDQEKCISDECLQKNELENKLHREHKQDVQGVSQTENIQRNSLGPEPENVSSTPRGAVEQVSTSESLANSTLQKNDTSDTTSISERRITSGGENQQEATVTSSGLPPSPQETCPIGGPRTGQIWVKDNRTLGISENWNASNINPARDETAISALSSQSDLSGFDQESIKYAEDAINLISEFANEWFKKAEELKALIQDNDVVSNFRKKVLASEKTTLKRCIQENVVVIFKKMVEKIQSLEKTEMLIKLLISKRETSKVVLPYVNAIWKSFIYLHRREAQPYETEGNVSRDSSSLSSVSTVANACADTRVPLRDSNNLSTIEPQSPTRESVGSVSHSKQWYQIAELNTPHAQSDKSMSFTTISDQLPSVPSPAAHFSVAVGNPSVSQHGTSSTSQQMIDNSQMQIHNRQSSDLARNVREQQPGRIEQEQVHQQNTAEIRAESELQQKSQQNQGINLHPPFPVPHQLQTVPSQNVLSHQTPHQQQLVEHNQLHLQQSVESRLLLPSQMRQTQAHPQIPVHCQAEYLKQQQGINQLHEQFKPIKSHYQHQPQLLEKRAQLPQQQLQQAQLSQQIQVQLPQQLQQAQVPQQLQQAQVPQQLQQAHLPQQQQQLQQAQLPQQLQRAQSSQQQRTQLPQQLQQAQVPQQLQQAHLPQQRQQLQRAQSSQLLQRAQLPQQRQQAQMPQQLQQAQLPQQQQQLQRAQLQQQLQQAKLQQQQQQLQREQLSPQQQQLQRAQLSPQQQQLQRAQLSPQQQQLQREQLSPQQQQLQWAQLSPQLQQAQVPQQLQEANLPQQQLQQEQSSQQQQQLQRAQLPQQQLQRVQVPLLQQHLQRAQLPQPQQTQLLQQQQLQRAQLSQQQPAQLPLQQLQRARLQKQLQQTQLSQLQQTQLSQLQQTQLSQQQQAAQLPLQQLQRARLQKQLQQAQFLQQQQQLQQAQLSLQQQHQQQQPQQPQFLQQQQPQQPQFLQQQQQLQAQVPLQQQQPQQPQLQQQLRLLQLQQKQPQFLQQQQRQLLQQSQLQQLKRSQLQQQLQRPPLPAAEKRQQQPQSQPQQYYPHSLQQLQHPYAPQHPSRSLQQDLLQQQWHQQQLGQQWQQKQQQPDQQHLQQQSPQCLQNLQGIQENNDLQQHQQRQVIVENRRRISHDRGESQCVPDREKQEQSDPSLASLSPQSVTNKVVPLTSSMTKETVQEQNLQSDYPVSSESSSRSKLTLGNLLESSSWSSGTHQSSASSATMTSAESELTLSNLLKNTDTSSSSGSHQSCSSSAVVKNSILPPPNPSHSFSAESSPTLPSMPELSMPCSKTSTITSQMGASSLSNSSVRVVNNEILSEISESDQNEIREVMRVKEVNKQLLQECKNVEKLMEGTDINMEVANARPSVLRIHEKGGDIETRTECSRQMPCHIKLEFDNDLRQSGKPEGLKNGRTEDLNNTQLEDTGGKNLISTMGVTCSVMKPMDTLNEIDSTKMENLSQCSRQNDLVKIGINVFNGNKPITQKENNGKDSQSSETEFQIRNKIIRSDHNESLSPIAEELRSRTEEKLPPDVHGRKHEGETIKPQGIKVRSISLDSGYKTPSPFPQDTAIQNKTLSATRHPVPVVCNSERQPICAVCQGEAHVVCSECRAICYCSEVCQQNHWYAGHREECVDDQ